MKRPAIKTREDAIRIIEDLWAPDSEHPGAAAIGRGTLEQAKNEVAGGWRSEPDAVLIRMAELQWEREMMMAQR